MAKLNWRKYPVETPLKEDGFYCECLCRGIANLPRTMHYYVCLWVWVDGCKGFFYGGNSFRGYCVNDEFEWIPVSELN